MLTTEQQISEQIAKAKRILITFNRNWTGDVVASALALHAWLKAEGKEADIVAEKPAGSTPFSFLPGYALIKHSLDNVRRFIITLDISNAEVDQVEYRVEDRRLDFIISPKTGFFKHEDISSRLSGYRYDLIITLGAPDLESLGSVYDNDTEFFFETTIINVDRHPANESFGQINIVDVNAVAVTEILYGFMSKADAPRLDADIATCLLTGLIAETKSFKTTSVTPNSLKAASDLVARDARREEIINALYRSRQLNVLKLWGLVLTRLRDAANGRLVWSTVGGQDFLDTGTAPGNLHDVIDDLIISMPEAQLIVLLYEENDGTRAIVHSVKNLDALDLTLPYKGEGTKSLALATLDRSLADAANNLIPYLEERIMKIGQ